MTARAANARPGAPPSGPNSGPNALGNGARGRKIAIIARTAYVLIILIATLSDLDAQFVPADVAARLVRAITAIVNFELRDAVDGVRNLILFAGFGALWVVTTASGKVWRSAWRATLAGTLISIGVEAVQLFSPVRTSSMLDVITNSIGTLGGGVGMCLLVLLVQERRGKRSFVGMPMLLFAGGYGIAAMFDAFIPLLRDVRLENLGGSIGVRIARGLAGMRIGIPLFDIPISDLLIFAPAGALAVAALAEAGVGYERAWRTVALYGTLIVAAMELIHGLADEPVLLGAIVLHAIAVTAGAWLAGRYLGPLTKRLRGAERPRVLLMGYAATILVWAWRPFYPDISSAAISAQFSAAHWIPLRALAGRVDLFSVTDVAVQFLLYLPIGALLAVWPVRARGPWSGILPALYLSAALELGKIIIADRFFDITHILIQSSGAVIGWLVVRRSGFTVHGALRPPVGKRADPSERRPRA